MTTSMIEQLKFLAIQSVCDQRAITRGDVISLERQCLYMN